MNQSASATRRPTEATATPGSCCPMFSAPFFINNFASQNPLIPPTATQQCFLGPQPQIASALLTGQQQPANAVQQQSRSAALSSSTQQASNSPTRQATQGLIDQTNTTSSNAYSAPLGAQQPTSTNLSLQHLLATNHSASNCVALAAALASASFPRFQQLHHAQSRHQHPSSHTNTTSTPSTTDSTSPTNMVANQVPVLTFNSYNSAQTHPSFINVSQHPVSAHLNSSQHHQPNSPPNENVSRHQSPQRSNTNSTNNVAINDPLNLQQQQATYGSSLQQLQQQVPTTRSILNDNALNSLFNEHFQAILLNQLFANHQFNAPIVSPPILAQHQAPINQSIARPVLMTTQQQVPLTPVVANLESEQVSDQARPPTIHSMSAAQHQNRLIPNLPIGTYSNPSASANRNTDSNIMYQPPPAGQQSHPTGQPTNNSTDSNISQQHHQTQPLQQQHPPTSSAPPLSFYTFPQMEQALALLANPQVANDIFSHVFNIYFRTSLRSDAHQSQQHQPHHFHHHMHNSHHHHNHSSGTQANGQEVTMPIDSLAISESKPRGLNRAEIDSLTPYIHINEKDSRTCVICLSKFELKSKIRPLPCNHAFHAKCVDKWLRANRTCPICRRDALKICNAKIKRI